MTSPAGSTVEVDPWIDRIAGFVERHPDLMRRLGDWETRFLDDRLADVSVENPIYIAGLARSGSTILLELLARHRDLGTHRYRDFPALQTPWLWSWFLDRAARPAEPRERAHRDRILVTPESPEAFEEPLWMAFDGHPEEEGPSFLGSDHENPRFETFYRQHVAKLLLLRGRKRYLAKANYNLLRLAYLGKLFPEARFLVPVRDPVWHVASLMKQHRLFCEASAEDPRVDAHLRRSGHFEFGPGRRIPHVGDEAREALIAGLWAEGREAEGWAHLWAMVYGKLGALLAEDSRLAERTRMVRYEALCADPEGETRRILAYCGLEPGNIPADAARIVSPPTYYEPAFPASETRAIRDITRDVARTFGYGGEASDLRGTAKSPSA